jgi:hypothetical protein
METSCQRQGVGASKATKVLILRTLEKVLRHSDNDTALVDFENAIGTAVIRYQL